MVPLETEHIVGTQKVPTNLLASCDLLSFSVPFLRGTESQLAGTEGGWLGEATPLKPDPRVTQSHLSLWVEHSTSVLTL